MIICVLWHNYWDVSQGLPCRFSVYFKYTFPALSTNQVHFNYILHLDFNKKRKNQVYYGNSGECTLFVLEIEKYTWSILF